MCNGLFGSIGGVFTAVAFGTAQVPVLTHLSINTTVGDIFRVVCPLARTVCADRSRDPLEGGAGPGRFACRWFANRTFG